MDFSQVLIPVIVIAPLIVFIVFTMKRRPANTPKRPRLESRVIPSLPRAERTASSSTTVTRELTLSAKHEKNLARLLKERGWNGALCQLPSLPPFFIGRRSELARTFALLDATPPPRALAITSARERLGVGRTGFAATLAHLLAERYPDGQLFIDLHGDDPADAALDVVEIMRHAVRTLSPGTPFPADLAELPSLYAQTLKGRRVLVLVENIRPQPHLELLHPPPGSLLLLTSREPDAFARIDTITIEPFSRPEARAFLRASGARITREPDKHLDLLAELSGYLPEALRLNARRIQTDPSQPIDWHIDQLKKAGAFKQPLEAARTLAGESFAPVHRDPPGANAPLSKHPESQPDNGGQGSIEGSWKSTRAFVQRFQSCSESDFSLTDLPAPFADPSRGPAPAYPDALRFLAKFPTTTNGLAHESVWLEAAVSAARALGDRTAEARALAMLGQARAKSGEPRLAVPCFEQWVEFARASGDRRAEADALGWLGAGWTGSGFADRGTGCFEAQLRIAREIGDRAGELHALGKLGHAKSTLGDFQNAAALHGEQLSVARDTGDRAAEVDALENLGVAWTRLKDLEKAAHFHEEQLLAARATGDQSAESRALGHLGHVALLRGKIEDAMAQYEAQLAVASRIGNTADQSHAHASLGVAWARQGDLRKAVAHYEQQLQIARQTSNRLVEATAQSNIGSGLERLGDLAGAAAAWEKALAIYESIGSPSADSMRRWLERLRKVGAAS